MKDHGQNPDKGIKAGAAPVSFNEVEKLTEEKYTIRKYKRILFYVVICVLLAAFLLGQYIYPRQIHAEFLVFRATQDTTMLRLASNTGLSPSVASLSRLFFSQEFLQRRGPTTPHMP